MPRTREEEVKKRLHNELLECFKIIDSCLALYYQGGTHMYRPLATQLRILFADQKGPLITRLFPNFKIQRLRAIEYVEPGQLKPFDDSSSVIMISHPANQEYKLARMPFLITEYSNGLQVADFEFDQSGELLPLADWVEQQVSIYPSSLTIKEIIKSVAEKGGGAHVDDELNQSLKDMMRTGPAGLGLHVLLVIALSRLAHRLGIYYIQFRERFDYNGKIEDIVTDFDPDHPSLQKMARIPENLEKQEKHQYALTVIRRIR